MLTKDALIHIESWWENSQVLHKDNEAEKIITCVGVPGVAKANYLPALLGLGGAAVLMILILVGKK